MGALVVYILSVLLVTMSCAKRDEADLFDTRMDENLYDAIQRDKSNRLDDEVFRRRLKQYRLEGNEQLYRRGELPMRLSDSVRGNMAKNFRKSLGSDARMSDAKRGMLERFVVNRPRGGRELLKDYASIQHRRMVSDRPRGGKRNCIETEDGSYRPRGGKRECDESSEANSDIV